MSEHDWLPKPFHDDTGFPLPLRHLRVEVERRGGVISGSGMIWRLTHPDPSLPDILIDIDDEGNVLVDAGHEVGMDVFNDEAWRTGPDERPWTHLEDVLLGFLEGGFTQIVRRDNNGRVTHHLMHLKGSHVSEAGGTATPVDESWTEETVSYPAWPPGDGDE
jgi:hypothetical protein